MTSTTEETDMTTTRPPMDPMRKTALVAGIFYLVTFVSIPTLGLYHEALTDHQFVLHSGSNAGLLWGAFLELIVALAGIGTAVTLFPVVKRQNEAAALGFVTTRVIEGAMIFVGAISILSIVVLRHDLAGSSGADAASLVTTATVLGAIYKWTMLLGQTLMPALNALLLGSLLYRSRLVPRILPTIGLVGAPILITSIVVALFRIDHPVMALAAIGTLPIAAWEFSLGVWLVVKGFTPSPLMATPAAAATGQPERQPALV